MVRFLSIIGIGVLFVSCSSKKEQHEEKVIPISSAKIAEVKGEVFDTIEFSRTKTGLHYVNEGLQNIVDKPDSNSHVAIEYIIVNKDGMLVHERDSSDKPCQIYIKECNPLLSEAICLLGRKSEVQVVLNSKYLKEIYSDTEKDENYLVDIRLVDFHQHYD